MRDIIFRGKLINNSKWSYGNLQLRCGQAGIIAITTPDNTVTGIYGKIDINTIGQYTGIKDKNGKEIYEGDILEDEEVRIKVLYELDGFYGQIIKLKKVCGTEVGLKYHLSFYEDDLDNLEVIGNIYDNPELLKEV